VFCKTLLKTLFARLKKNLENVNKPEYMHIVDVFLSQCAS
jgi:hypothetical protein